MKTKSKKESGAPRRINQNVWGNWNGYRAGRKVAEFGTDELRAKEWLEQTEGQAATQAAVLTASQAYALSVKSKEQRIEEEFARVAACIRMAAESGRCMVRVELEYTPARGILLARLKDYGYVASETTQPPGIIVSWRAV